jgi:hypothetical protein
MDGMEWKVVQEGEGNVFPSWVSGLSGERTNESDGLMD